MLMKAEENQPAIMTIDDVFDRVRDFLKKFIVESFELDIEKGEKGSDIIVAFRIAS